MISAALGMVIMSAATVAMLVALEITTNELKKSGKYYPTVDERVILENAGFTNKEIRDIEAEIDQIDFGNIQN
tara:strand:+ start:1780 stop:1998 length:219 start_codon:yes stop_codon:yes gene_type:complete